MKGDRSVLPCIPASVLWRRRVCRSCGVSLQLSQVSQAYRSSLHREHSSRITFGIESWLQVYSFRCRVSHFHNPETSWRLFQSQTAFLRWRRRQRHLLVVIPDFISLSVFHHSAFTTTDTVHIEYSLHNALACICAYFGSQYIARGCRK